MSSTEYDADVEALSDREKTHCRRNRRPSVQFIDKNLIRRRSSGLEKHSQHNQIQVPRLPSINSNDETESTDDVDQQQKLLTIQYCERNTIDRQFPLGEGGKGEENKCVIFN